MSSATPNLAIEYLVAGQSSPEITLNEALNLLDAVICLSVLDTALSAAPGSPTSGDRYIVSPSPGSSDPWYLQDNNIAYYDTGNGWGFIVPKEGTLVWNQATTPRQLQVYTASAWVVLATAAGSTPTLDQVLTAGSTTSQVPSVGGLITGGNIQFTGGKIVDGLNTAAFDAGRKLVAPDGTTEVLDWSNSDLRIGTNAGGSPSNTATPVSWYSVWIQGTQYWFPMYQ